MFGTSFFSDRKIKHLLGNINHRIEGVRAIKLAEGDEVVGVCICREGGTVLTVTENGKGRRSDIDTYRITARGGKGIRNYDASKDKVAAVKIVDDIDDVLLSSQEGIIIPHHTNEIAQSEAFLGHKWCPYWFHVLHLNDARGKMSKSKGGFLTVSLLEEKGYNPLVYRMFCLQSHYRKPLTFSYDNLDNTATAYNKLVKRISALSRDGEPDMAKAEELTKGFREALDNDLNTSLALTCVYDVLKADADDATKLYVIGEFDKVLSLDLTKVPESNKADADDDFAKEVEELIAQRTKARAEKDWATADAIRDKLKEMKVVVKDTKDGIEWHVEG